jgi:hypothetical protein
MAVSNRTGDALLGFLASLAAAACGTSSAGVCASNDDCPAGDVCGLDGECATVTAPPPAVADAGTPPPDAPGSVCEPRSLSLAPLVPSIHFVLDQSGTMNNNLGGVSRYRAMRDALVGTGGAVVDNEAGVAFGITLYTSHNGGSTCPLLQNEERRVGNAAAITARLDANTPDGDNPLAETLNRVTSDFAIAPAAPGAAAVIVVATDGMADSCTNSDDGSGVSASIQATTEAHAAGIEVVMVSIGTGVQAGYLQEMANAGAGITDDDRVSATFFVADDTADLRDAFGRIVRDARCRLDARALSAAELSAAAMSLDGDALVEGTDWIRRDDGTVDVLGGACTALLASATPAVTANLDCE